MQTIAHNSRKFRLSSYLRSNITWRSAKYLFIINTFTKPIKQALRFVLKYHKNPSWKYAEDESSQEFLRY